MISDEPLLEKLRLDVNIDVSLDEQKEAGKKYLQRHCLDFLETAKMKRQVRMEHARDAYLERVRLREQEELQRKKEKDERLAKMNKEKRLAEESRRREEQEEEVRLKDWPGNYFHQVRFPTYSHTSFMYRLHRTNGALKKKKLLHLLLLPRMKRPSAARSDVPLPKQLRLNARRR
jgi:hypothetical protein